MKGGTLQNESFFNLGQPLPSNLGTLCSGRRSETMPSLLCARPSQGVQNQASASLQALAAELVQALRPLVCVLCCELRLWLPYSDAHVDVSSI